MLLKVAALCILLLASFRSCWASQQDFSEISGKFVIVYRSQINRYHAQQAESQVQSVTKQAKELSWKIPKIYLTHKHWPNLTGSWTLFPFLKVLVEKHKKSSHWILFLEEYTSLNLKNLVKFISKFKPSEEHFFGHQLKDEESTIIHHFDEPSKFTYPDFAAGIILSMVLLKKINKAWQESVPHDFAIDPQYELAKFITEVAHGPELHHREEFCLLKKNKNCITSVDIYSPKCGSAVSSEEVVYAVKTCKKFHDERVPIVKKTWARDARNLIFFSDVVDESVPAVSVEVQNYDKGHCAKLFKIFRYLASSESTKNKTWVVIADDDTLISIPRLHDLLSCYNGTEMMALGERYGFGVTRGSGYDYLTGGAGMVLNMATVKRLMVSKCECPAEDAPDDMVLGACLRKINVPITHSPLFHQARPLDYSRTLLEHQRPVTFHKYWMVDPLKVYKDWLSIPERNLHTEL